MNLVMTLCPETKVPVGTGHFLNQAQFDGLKGERFFRCTICHRAHAWDRSSAWLEERLRPGEPHRARYTFKCERVASGN